MSEVNNGRDPLLQNLFIEAQHDLEGDEFAHQVISRTRNLTYLAVGGCAALALIAALSAWLFDIPYELVELVSGALTQPLILLQEGWVAWVLSPINNVAGLLVIFAKAGRMIYKRVRG